MRRRWPTGCRREAVVEIQAASSASQAKLRAKQIWHWIYNRGVSDFAAMSDIAKAAAPWLAERFVIPARGGRGAGVDRRHPQMAAATHDGHDFEMVFIPDADRGTCACRARSAAR
jgi:23S rRNA (adenine2503-C2)-methyltransferase